MQLPTTFEFAHRDVAGARIYRVQPDVELVAVHVAAPLPGAPAGAFVYAFVLQHRVGTWNWTAEPDALIAIMRAFRDTTSPDYEPPDQLAPGGEPAQIRAPVRHTLDRLIARATPPSNAFLGRIDQLRFSARAGESIRFLDDDEG